MMADRTSRAAAKAQSAGIEGLKKQDIRHLMVQMSDLIEAGCQVSRALEAISRQSKGRSLGQLAEAINNQIVNSGSSLAGAMESMGDVFSEVHISMIRAAEAGGFLSNTLSSMAEHISQQSEISKQIKGKLAYPAVLAFTVVASVMFLLTYVVPRFVQVYRSAHRTLPFATRALLAVSGFIESHFIILLIGVLLVILLCRGLLRVSAIRLSWDSVMLRLPIVGRLVRDLETYRFARTMSLLIAGGVGVLKSLRLARGVVSNQRVRGEVDALGDAVERGEAISGQMRTSSVFDETTMEMIAVSEATGKLGEVLDHLASQRYRDFQRKVGVLMSLVEPAIILVMGVLVGLTVMALLLPVLSMNTLIK